MLHYGTNFLSYGFDLDKAVQKSWSNCGYVLGKLFSNLFKSFYIRVDN